VTNPLLIHGKKFDIRAYCLIARNDPTSLVYYHEGYVRCSVEDFTMDSEKLDDLFVHLTNAAIQRKHPNYAEKKEETMWSFERLCDYVASTRENKTVADLRKSLNESFRNICRDVYMASKDKLAKKKGYFDLLGFDFMLDEDLNPVLIEVSELPASMSLIDEES